MIRQLINKVIKSKEYKEKYKRTNQGIVRQQTNEKGEFTQFQGIPADYGTFKKAIHGSQSQFDINCSFNL